MVFRNFRLHVVIHSLFLIATVFLFVYLVLQASHPVGTIALGAMILAQVFALIVFVERTTKKVTKFLEAIEYSNFTQTFSAEGHGKVFEALSSAFNRIIAKFRAERFRTEEHYHYLQTVVQHISIALVAFRSDGEVTLVNDAAIRLLGLHSLVNINKLESISSELVEVLKKMKTGERSIVTVPLKGEVHQLLLNASEFHLQSEDHLLVSLQNITGELEKKELEAWQNLMKVLTHEILNSITPITSLACTANDLMKSYESAVAGEKIAEDDRKALLKTKIANALDTIEKRGKSLISFVESYRTLTHFPKPRLEFCLLREVIKRVESLLRAKLEEKQVIFRANVDPPHLEVLADEQQIEQVLINLVINSVEALDGRANAIIDVRGGVDDRGHAILEVADNGSGMNKEVLSRSVIPFFTTKPSGSGIGLSLARQVMQMHGGSLILNSEPNVGTVVLLRFQ